MPRIRAWGAARRSYSAAFGVFMIVKPSQSKRASVHRGVVSTIGTLAASAIFPVLFPVLAHAQVNIDQGKPASEIYSSVCAVCHKTPRGLAPGKNSLALTSFLSQHYTASREQAAALASYVLSSGGAEAAPKKPEVEHAREEPKNAPKVTARGKPEAGRPKEEAKRDEAKPLQGEAKREEPSRPKEEAKREEHPAPAGVETKPEDHPETASREEPKPSEAGPVPSHEAAPTTAAPSPAPTGSEPPHLAEAQPNPPTATPAPGAVAVPDLELGSSVAAEPPKNPPRAKANLPRDRIPD